MALKLGLFERIIMLVYSAGLAVEVTECCLKSEGVWGNREEWEMKGHSIDTHGMLSYIYLI
jgi:hypothetical protein